MRLFTLTKGERRRLNSFVAKFATKHNIKDVFVGGYHVSYNKIGKYTFADVKFEVLDKDCNPVFYPYMKVLLEDRRYSRVFMVMDTNGHYESIERR